MTWLASPRLSYVLRAGGDLKGHLVQPSCPRMQMGVCVTLGHRPLCSSVCCPSEMAVPQRGSHTLGPTCLEPPLRCSASMVVISDCHPPGLGTPSVQTGPPLPVGTGLEKGIRRLAGDWYVLGPGPRTCMGITRDLPFGLRGPPIQ